MSTLTIAPHSGLNRRFPQHRLTEKKTQKVSSLVNFLSLDGNITKVRGSERYDSTSRGTKTAWLKRIYYEESGDRRKHLFSVIDGKMYRGTDHNQLLNQVKVNDSFDPMIDPNVYPLGCSIKVADTISNFIVDGKHFFKFNGNDGGEWAMLTDKEDIDGNTIEPVDMVEYLDRAWVLVKNRNVVLVSQNLNPEVYDDADDSVLIECPTGNGGFPQKLIVHRGFIYVVHEDYIAPISGSSPLTFGIRPGDVINGFGTRAPRSVLSLKTEFGFLNSYDNEYYLTGGTLDSTNKTPLSYEINLNELINPIKAQDTVAHLDTLINAIRISYVASGDSRLDEEVIYSLSEEKWCGQTRGFGISCYAQWDGRLDEHELTTGRSDSGLVMFMNRGQNIDGSAMFVDFVSADYLDDGISELQFEEFWLDGLPTGQFGIPFFYYLDARLTTNGQQDLEMTGEQINVGLISIAEQTLLVNKVRPLIDKSKGRMIRFQITGNMSDRDLEFNTIYAVYNKQNIKFSKYIVGR